MNGNQAGNVSPAVLLVPVVIGPNRLRGNAAGPMVQDDDGGILAALRRVLSEEARLVNVDPTSDWLARSVSQILKLYDEGLHEFQSGPREPGVIGFVYEMALSPRTTLLLGEARVLPLAKTVARSNAPQGATACQ